ncbi:MAG TPA: hypothetical protein PLD88_00410, partial [Candidatus Berkiella sp.]|nr:hypothetical protein [Candidatus Berkiella sp.]
DKIKKAQAQAEMKEVRATKTQSLAPQQAVRSVQPEQQTVDKKERDALFQQMGFIKEVKEGNSVLEDLGNYNGELKQWKIDPETNREVKHNYNELSNNSARTGIRVYEEIISSERSYAEGLAAFTPERIEKMLNAFDKLSSKERGELTRDELETMLKSLPLMKAICDKMITALEKGDLAEVDNLMNKSANVYARYASVHKPLPLKLNQDKDNGKAIFPKVNNKDANSYLITPVQRFPRYGLLARDVLKQMPSGAQAIEAFETMRVTADMTTGRMNVITGDKVVKSGVNHLQKEYSKNFKASSPEGVMFASMLREMTRERERMVSENKEPNFHDIVMSIHNKIMENPIALADFKKVMTTISPTISKN